MYPIKIKSIVYFSKINTTTGMQIFWLLIDSIHLGGKVKIKLMPESLHAGYHKFNDVV